LNEVYKEKLITNGLYIIGTLEKGVHNIIGCLKEKQTNGCERWTIKLMLYQAYISNNHWDGVEEDDYSY